jgi:hypothetical protein
MNIFKHYLFPIIVAAIAGVLIGWALDGFPHEAYIYFIKSFVVCLIPAVVVVIMVNMAAKKSRL